jgi:hypothetical protein
VGVRSNSVPIPLHFRSTSVPRPLRTRYASLPDYNEMHGLGEVTGDAGHDVAFQ